MYGALHTDEEVADDSGRPPDGDTRASAIEGSPVVTNLASVSRLAATHPPDAPPGVAVPAASPVNSARQAQIAFPNSPAFIYGHAGQETMPLLFPVFGHAGQKWNRAFKDNRFDNEEEGGSSSSGFSTPRSKKAARSFRKASLTVSPPLIIILVGVAALMHYEEWNFTTSAYVITQMVTTIGYGDFTVHTAQAKIFMSFYSVGVLIILAYYFNKILQDVVNRESDFLRSYLRRVEMMLNTSIHDEQEAERMYGPWNKVIALALLFGGMILVGTLFYRFFEHCTCSYGASRVAGCSEVNYHTCIATGGYRKDWASSFYMSVVTLSTIGFGDEQPRTLGGRLFGILWMLMGVVTTALFMSAVTAAFFEQSRHHTFRESEELQSIDEATFKKIDRDGNGCLERGEFLAYTLVKYGAVSEDVIDHINRTFDRLDVQGNNHVTFEAIQARQHAIRLAHDVDGKKLPRSVSGASL